MFGQDRCSNRPKPMGPLGPMPRPAPGSPLPRPPGSPLPRPAPGRALASPWCSLTMTSWTPRWLEAQQLAPMQLEEQSQEPKQFPTLTNSLHHHPYKSFVLEVLFDTHVSKSIWHHFQSEGHQSTLNVLVAGTCQGNFGGLF